MSPQHADRRLVAVLAADLVGYAGHMEQDERGTYERLVRLRAAVLDPAVERHSGQLIKNMGDGFIAIFPSAVSAASCALAIQAVLAEAEADPTRRFQFRIGLNIAEVIVEQGDVYGEGVNVAARLQTYAEPGGIVVTAAVADQIQGKLPVGASDLGDLPLKSLSQPVRAFVLHPAEAPPSPVRTVPHDAQRPSVAVLPFRHAPADPEQSYFADGVVEEVIRALAQLNELLVISHSTTLRYAGTVPDVPAIARELGVRYVLSGSLRRSGDDLRITVELSDAERSVVVWAQRFDAKLAELFSLQDHISAQVANTLAPHVRERELRRALRKHPDSMDAYDFMLQGLDQLYRMDYASFSRARGLLQKAVSLDPGYARAYAYIAKWHNFRVGQGWSPDRAADAAEAARFAAAAVARDGSDSLALAFLGHIHSFLLKDPITGADHLNRSRSLGPSNAMAWALSSCTYTYLGYGVDAIMQAEQALRLAPLDTHAFFYLETMALAQYWSGNHAEAVVWAERSVRHNPAFCANLRCLIAGLVATGREDEARAYAELLLKNDPRFNLQDFIVRSPFHKLAGHSLFIERLRRAGLPEYPTVNVPLRTRCKEEL